MVSSPHFICSCSMTFDRNTFGQQTLGRQTFGPVSADRQLVIDIQPTDIWQTHCSVDAATVVWTTVSSSVAYTKYILWQWGSINTNLKYKLLCFLTPNKKISKKKALAFDRDRSCHLALCLQLILFHCKWCLGYDYIMTIIWDACTIYISWPELKP